MNTSKRMADSLAIPTRRHTVLIHALTLISTVGVVLSLLLLTPASSSAITKGDKRKARSADRAVTRPLTRAQVKEAEARLADMGYGSGSTAVVSFQKWEGRKVTGRLNREDYDLIMNATAPQAKETGYRHVEVDIDRQLLLMTDDEGNISKIIPVSSGSNKQYREKGGSGLAYTPKGRFRVTGKIAGWRKSPLGLLYYPSYFSGGVAIHGNPSVPNQPESHGCVRIPMSAAVEVYKLLPVGTIVLIYDKQGFVSAKDWAEADKEAVSRKQ